MFTLICLCLSWMSWFSVLVKRCDTMEFSHCAHNRHFGFFDYLKKETNSYFLNGIFLLYCYFSQSSNFLTVECITMFYKCLNVDWIASYSPVAISVGNVKAVYYTYYLFISRDWNGNSIFSFQSTVHDVLSANICNLLLSISYTVASSCTLFIS